ncbi:hypothetical protein VPHG_00173 [Vibrio phage 11895-B1]|uniref:hypothetical protein n=1 Tax=Vibrio phage 11895-B1 TaxID=754075 RepID=UPI0002C064BB|nr:hypothetical protein VPHG_00173 [Vibrio phage 11895-B1]AGH32236.1 hypothetical protein VPHG_00173 [Vibrio phage 11895-B1]
MKIDLFDGKYTYIFDNGKQKALRHGGEWRDLTGDNLIYAMACRIEELDIQLSQAIEIIEDSGVDFNEVVSCYETN